MPCKGVRPLYHTPPVGSCKVVSSLGILHSVPIPLPFAVMWSVSTSWPFGLLLPRAYGRTGIVTAGLLPITQHSLGSPGPYLLFYLPLPQAVFQVNHGRSSNVEHEHVNRVHFRNLPLETGTIIGLEFILTILNVSSNFNHGISDAIQRICIRWMIACE